jgi:hypothetical protein
MLQASKPDLIYEPIASTEVGTIDCQCLNLDIDLIILNITISLL